MRFTLSIVLFFYLSCGGNGGGSSDSPKPPVNNNGVETSQSVAQTTPKGVRVYSQSGVSASALSLMDVGMDKVFADATASGYKNMVGVYAYFNVYIPVKPCVPSPVDRVPSFLVRADNYDGTQFDQNPSPGIGEVLAVEMVISDNAMIVCPDEQFLVNEVDYGSEHILIRLSDPEYYLRSQTHTTIFHPLLPHIGGAP